MPYHGKKGDVNGVIEVSFDPSFFEKQTRRLFYTYYISYLYPPYSWRRLRNANLKAFHKKRNEKHKRRCREH
jgi:hypothetical protein